MINQGKRLSIAEIAANLKRGNEKIDGLGDFFNPIRESMEGFAANAGTAGCMSMMLTPLNALAVSERPPTLQWLGYGSFVHRVGFT